VTMHGLANPKFIRVIFFVTMSFIFLPQKRYDMIYLLTAIWLSPGGSTHLHTNNTQNNTNNNGTTQIQTNVEECGPCPVFASFTLAFALKLRKKHGKTSARLRNTSVRLRKTSVTVQKNLSHSTEKPQSQYRKTSVTV
jgi:hypothetical protein